jgi:hypothetical protein
MPTTREQVLRQRRRFTEDGYPTFVTEVNGIHFTCFVLPERLCPNLPNFAFQCVANDRSEPDQDAVFGVSAGIKPAWRPFVAAHEIREYWIGMTCPEAARAEASSVMNSNLSEEEQEAYIRMRKEFFSLLVPFAQANSYNPAKIEEFEGVGTFFFTLSELPDQP